MATSNTAASRSLLFGEPREDWLALRQEDVIDPERPIVDAHHHLWDRGGQRYMIEEITGISHPATISWRPSMSIAARCIEPADRKRCDPLAKLSLPMASPR
jgi:hypothetical protein